MFLHLLSRMYNSSSTFYAQNLALEIVDQQKSVNVYLHITRECSAEEPFMCSILCHREHLFPVLAYDFLSRCKFSNLPSTPMYSSSLYAKTLFEIVHEESFLHAEPVKPPSPLHLRLPGTVAELAVYVFREHHARSVLLFSVHTLPFF